MWVHEKNNQIRHDSSHDGMVHTFQHPTRIKTRHLHVDRFDDRVKKFLAYFGIFVLETRCQFVEQHLGCQHAAVQYLAKQELGFFADRVSCVAQPIDDMRQYGWCVYIEVLAEPVDQFGEGFEGFLCDL